MTKKKLVIVQSDSQYGGYYRLIPPKLTLLERIKSFALKAVLLPYQIYQTVVGRLLSYFVINPLFRKDEQDYLEIVQNRKYKDNSFLDSDEMLIINVYPKNNVLIRLILSWHNFLTNHVPGIGLLNSLFSALLKLLPSGSQTIERYLDTVVDTVAEQITNKGSNGNSFSPDQIHFRGLEKLTDKQQEYFFTKLKEHTSHDFATNRKKLYFYTLQTTDNALLDSVEVRPEGASEQDMSTRRFMVSCMPRSNNYTDWLKQHKIYARETNSTVIAFNYRGTGLSKGLVTNQQSLYSDAYEQVQRLLALGAKPENIIMIGECLGANVATHTAGRLHEEGNAVKLFNARSFRSLPAMISGHLPSLKNAPIWHPKTWLSVALHLGTRCVLNPIIWSADWMLNVEDKFTSIPPHDRDYMVVRSNKDEKGHRFADDTMVPHKKASIYSLAKEKHLAMKRKQESGAQLSAEELEWCDEVPRHHKFFVSPISHAKAATANGHTVVPSLLTTSKVNANNPSIDGRQYTLNSINRLFKPAKTEENDHQGQQQNNYTMLSN